MIVEDVARWLADYVGVAGVPIGLVVTLLVVAYHGQHLLSLGRSLALGVRVGIVVAVLLAVLVATPAFEVDVGTGRQLVDGVSDVVRYLVGLPEVVAS